MLNKKVFAIIKRELNEKLMSKSFIFMTIIMPVIMLALMALPSLLMMYQGDKGTRLDIVTESAPLTGTFQKMFAELGFVRDATYSLSFNTVSASMLKTYIDNKKKELISRKLDGITFIPDKALRDKQVEYYSNTPGNLRIPEKLQGPINEVLIDQYFSTKTLSREDLFFARMSVRFSGFKVSKKDEIEEQGVGNVILAFVLTFMIYMSVIFSGQMTLQSVINEKNSKVVEILLSSVSSKELMTGKIFGSTITSTAQMAIWLLPILALRYFDWLTLPEKIMVDVSLGYLLYFLINFLLAVLIFHGLFATVGAIFDNPQEAQNGMMPVILLLVIPFIISISMIPNPNNPIAAVSSYIPFATLIVMPARLSLVDLPFWHPIISILINIATILLIFPLAGKIYSVGILRVGKRPTWGEVMKWLKS